MGQQYLGAALLNKFEGMYVANFDLPNIYKDSTRSPEAAIVQMFEEVKRHKPSVIYIPNVDIWYRSLQDSVIKTFTGLLRSLPPTDPVLLLGIMELSSSTEKPDMNMIRDLFSYSTKNLYQLERPDQAARQEYFSVLVDYVRRSPAEFPDPENRKKREIPVLPEAPSAVTANKEPTKDDLKKQKKNDRYTLFTLKLHIQPVMDQIKLKYKKFRMPPIDERTIEYLFNEQDPEMLTTDLAEEQAQELMYRPYKIDTDGKGVTGLREIATGRFYYNLDIAMIEDRLSNGYYKRPTDFRADIKRLAKDAKTMGDHERILKANEMYANVEVDMTHIETAHPALVAECEAVYQRELAREAEMRQKGKQAVDPPLHSDVANAGNGSAEPSTTSNHLAMQDAEPTVSTPSKSDLSNGVAHHGQEDVEMGNTTSGEQGSGPQPQYTTPVQGTQTKSQHSSIMQMAPGSQPKDYVNSASTTTSGQKTTDRSNRDSGHTGNTQMSNGTGHGNGGIDFSLIEPLSASQLPDTQEQPNASQITPLSSPTQNHPQPMGPPVAPASHAAVGQSQSPPDPAGPQHARRASDIDSLLNHPSGSQSQPVAGITASGNGQTSTRSPILVPADNNVLAEMSRQLVHRSSGLSVEQLEQVMASLMRAIWNSKSEWNRNMAVKAVEGAFNETIRDLESVQEIMKPSQDDSEYADVTTGRRTMDNISGGSSVPTGNNAWWGAQSAP